MRLVCPNCEAKYEVPEDAIPETGRDVQCANCGHAWYQMRARAAVVETPPAAAPVVAPPVAPAPAPVVEAAPEPVPEPVPEPEVAAAPAVEVRPDPVPEPQVVAETVPEVAPEAAAPVAEAAVAEAAPAEAAPAEAAVAEAAPAEADPSTSPEVVEAVAEAPSPAADLGPAPETVAETVAETIVETVAETVAGAASAGAAEALPDLDDRDESASVAAQAGAAGAAAAASAPAAYAVDDSVLAILREEAEREAQARRAEAAKPLEVQEDLGIDTAMPDARSSGMASVEPAAATLAANRMRLPDVEEIKSTLRPDETLLDTAEANSAAAPVEGRSSFRKGFSLVIVLAILGAALYVSADSLKAAVPALAGVLDAYVGFVDSLRLQLDGLMQSATLAINGT